MRKLKFDRDKVINHLKSEYNLMSGDFVLYSILDQYEKNIDNPQVCISDAKTVNLRNLIDEGIIEYE